MRRQRVLRTSSAQSLCLFCACRLGVNVPSSQLAPLVSNVARSLGTTSTPRQSAFAAAAHSTDNAPLHNDPPGFVFDPSSSLTEAEQREKAQRQAIWRQRQAREQELKQQQIWEQSQTKAREAEERRARIGQGSFSWETTRNTFRSIGINTVSQSPEPSPSSAGMRNQGLTLSQGLFNDPQDVPRKSSPSSRKKTLGNNHRTNGQNPRIDPGEVNSSNQKTAQRDRKTAPTVLATDPMSKQVFSAPKKSQSQLSNASNKARFASSNLLKSKKVILPEFFKGPQAKDHNAAQAAPGWGAGATVMMPVEYGDVVREHVLATADDSPTSKNASQDAPRTSATSYIQEESNSKAGQARQHFKSIPRDVDLGRPREAEPSQPVRVEYENTRELQQQWNGASEPAQPIRLEYENSHERPQHQLNDSPDASIAENVNEYAFTKNTRGDQPYKPDANPLPPSGNALAPAAHHQHNESEAPSVHEGPASTSANIGSFGNYENENYLETTLKRSQTPHHQALLGTYDSVTSYWKPAQTYQSEDAAPDHHNPVAHDLKSAMKSDTFGSYESDSEFMPEYLSGQTNATRVSWQPSTPAQNPPLQSARPGAGYRPQQPSETRSAFGLPLEPAGQSRGAVGSPQSSSETSPPPLSQASPAESSHQRSPHSYSDTGYHATPIHPSELHSSSQSFAEDHAANWQHLRRKDPEPQQPQPTQVEFPAQQPTRQQAFRDDDPAWVDQIFRAHQEQRPQPIGPLQTARDQLTPQAHKRMEKNANRKCGRCGEKGHVAVECTGPKRPNIGSSRDRRQPRRSVFDDPFDSERHTQEPQPGQGRISYNDPFSIPPHGLQKVQPRRAPNNSQYNDRFNVSSDERPHRENRRPRNEDNAAFNRFSAGPTVRSEARSRVPNPFANADDTYASPSSSEQPHNERQRFMNIGRGSSSNTDKPVRRPFATGSQRASSRNSEDGNLPMASQRPQQSTEADERRSSRRAKWEHPEEVVQDRENLVDRRKEQRRASREVDDEDDEHEGARDAYRARKAARQAAKESEKLAKNKAHRRKREARKAEQAAPITLPEFISVQHLSQMLGVRYEPFVERLEALGYDDVFPGKILDSETSGMIAMEYNFEPSFDTGAREEEERDLKPRLEVDDRELLPVRPPVVTIMGHVDHGKTTILDYLRKSSVAAGEAGGITQHIGAFSVPLASTGKTITFLDTPGHAAFLAMRQRGATVTDIVVLVVAADDSVKPQTLEALKHAKAAGVSMIVAINKIDKEEADVQRCKQDLARHGVEIEDFGGDTQVVCVSGKTGRGMDELEESLVTLSEILDHRADTGGAVEGWVLEATTKKAGRVATVLIRRGTLKPGCVLVAGKTWARVRSLRNETGKALSEVGPGMPVEVDGWKDQPVAGDEVLQAPSEQKATSVVEYRLEIQEREKTAQDMEAINEARRIEQEKREEEKAAEFAAKRAAASVDGGDSTAAAHVAGENSAVQQSGQITIPFIIKADVSGSAEAVSAYVLSVSSPLIAPQVLHSGVGAIHESDIELASTASGHIIAFNLAKDDEMKGAAEARGVKVLENNVIYRVLDDVKAILEEKLPPIVTQRVLGEAEIGIAFEVGVGGRKKVKIAGCKVRNGAVNRGGRVKVIREGEKIYDGTISSLKNVKKDVQEMRKGSECGMGFENWEGFEVGDQIQTYEEIRERRKL